QSSTRAWGRLVAATLGTVVLLISARSYVDYDSHGWRNEPGGQADWRAMAQFVADLSRPDDMVDVPVADDTWARLHFMFYYEQHTSLRETNWNAGDAALEKWRRAEIGRAHV